MRGIVLGLLLIQLNPPPTGVVTGQVQGPDGKPAAGVRVFAIPAGDVQTTDRSSLVIETLGQTDTTGHYRLEVPTGRYAIAAGSVEMPTFFPSASTLSAATIVSVAEKTTLTNIDFSHYVPAAISFSELSITNLPPPGATGILSGVILNSDGTPATKVVVGAVSVAAISSGSALIPYAVPTGTNITSPTANSASLAIQNTVSPLVATRFNRVIYRSTTDSSGHFVLNNVAPDTYYIVTGIAEEPVFYPGTTDIAMASTISTTPTTNLNNVNVQIPTLHPGATVTGKITTISGEPAAGATVDILLKPLNAALTSYLPVLKTRSASARDDGTFAIPGVRPGSYSITSNLPYVHSMTRTITVANSSLADVDFVFPVTRISGRILSEDGTLISEFKHLAIRTASLTSISRSLDVHVTEDGRFSELLENEDYRIFYPSLSNDFAVRSIIAGAKDITRAQFNIPDDTRKGIEIRVGRRSKSDAMLSGKILDAVTGAATAASRVRLCCYDSGPVERVTAVIQQDGSFEFHEVPPPPYTAELESSVKLSLINPNLDTQRGTELTWISYSQARPVVVTSTLLFGGAQTTNLLFGIAQPSGMKLTFSGMQWSGKTVGLIDPRGIMRVELPAGERYRVTVSDIPEGYGLVSMASGNIDLMKQELTVAYGPLTQIPISITISRTSPGQ